MTHQSDIDSAAEIKQRIAGYVRHLTTSRDADAAIDHYTEDARLLGPGMDMNREAVGEVIRGALEGGVEITVNRRTLELFMHGDIAYEIAQAEDTLVNPDGTSTTLHNNLFIRWERDSLGVWRFARVLASPRQLPGT